MKASTEWKDFEKLVERLHRGFHQNATIKRDDRILGRNTGVLRQIDVSIRYELGPTKLLLIVDCKKWRRTVDAPAMDSFIGLKDDVGAHVGILVCEKGFSKAAKRLAEKHNVELFTVADTQKPQWQVRARVRVFVEEWLLSSLLLRYVDPNGVSTTFADDREFNSWDENGKQATVAGTVMRLWNEHPEKKPGDYYYQVGAGPDKDCSGKLVFGFRASVKCYSRSAKLGLLGLKNVRDGLTYTDSFKVETTAEPINEYEHQGFPQLKPDEAFGVLIVSVEPKTVNRVIPNLDLKTNHIEFSLTSGLKPFTFSLPELQPKQTKE